MLKKKTIIKQKTKDKKKMKKYGSESEKLPLCALWLRAYFTTGRRRTSGLQDSRTRQGLGF